MSYKIGVVDTTFATIDMYKFVKKAIDDSFESVKLVRKTVPGVKDLPIACKHLLKECDIVLALGMPGPKDIDKICAHEASQALLQVQLLTNKPIIEVFVHMDEAKSNKQLYEIAKDRAYKHALNAISLLKNSLQRYAGKGKRQGSPDIGEIR